MKSRCNTRMYLQINPKLYLKTKYEMGMHWITIMTAMDQIKLSPITCSGCFHYIAMMVCGNMATTVNAIVPTYQGAGAVLLIGLWIHDPANCRILADKVSSMSAVNSCLTFWRCSVNCRAFFMLTSLIVFGAIIWRYKEGG